MAIEKERKFLLKEDVNPIILASDKGADAAIIKQAYLMLGDKQQLRVRIVNDEVSFMCYKHCKSDTERGEYECPMNIVDAYDLYASTELRLVKLRYSWGEYFGKRYQVCLDCYPGGLKVVEIEYDDILTEDFIKSLKYLGEEVTGIAGFSNIIIAKNNAERSKI